ncbi:MAG TPA: hypothetical protein DDZ89_17510 [Clostridiales bacterium]|nr:hypothetical protein [Clostridiales bacterium]
MLIELTTMHWIYLVFILAILGFMIARKDTSLVCVVGIFILGIVATSDITQSVMGIFNSFIYAISELLGTILIISVITAMSKVLMKAGINETMVRPFTSLIRTPTLAYWVIGILMMIISFFFWPSPAVALMGAVLLPVAVRVGLPAIGVAMAMNLFGHGIALSGDFIIQGAPKLTAEAAGLPVNEVVSASIPLVITMGIVTTVLAFLFLRRDMKKGLLKAEPTILVSEKEQKKEKSQSVRQFSERSKKVLAILIPLLFILDIVAMSVFKLQGGDATALIGGTALFIMILISVLAHGKDSLEKITEYTVEGFYFGFKVFGPVIPIAAFFYMGDSGINQILGNVLPVASNGIVNDLGVALAHAVPLNSIVASITSTIVGAITGLDGSGFSGISLTGSIARLFSTAIGHGTASLTALGQISGIWVGGGTLIPWALLPAAAICNVNPFDLARRNLKPVVIGLIVTTIVAIFLL